jgi:PII-like signaling protein
MKGTCLKFYVQEKRKHRHILLYEWLLERARQMGIHGGSAFRAIAGFGRHGEMHEAHFFELEGDLPVEVVFMVTNEEADRLLSLIREEKLTLFVAKFAVDYETLS